MTLYVIAYLAGVLTIASPCILPVLPFVLARAGQPFRSSGFPMLAAMAIAFAAVASLAAVAGSWAIELNRHGRTLALVLFGFFGLALVFPSLSARLTAPLVAIGNGLTQSADERGWGKAGGFGSSALLGVATGLLWAPCAGPVLGLILSGAALGGASLGTSLLLLAYAGGAATSLALALMFGGRLFRVMKGLIGIGDVLRRAFGTCVLLSVAAISLGLDTGLLKHFSLAGTNAVEKRLIDLLIPDVMSGTSGEPALLASASTLGKFTTALFGGTLWLDSSPPTSESVRGKVVLVNFWTYSCINCLRSLPYVRAWADKYRDQGLVVIGVHTPEFAFEKRIDNVRKAAASLSVSYPVAIDNDYRIWRAFDNRAWPARYFIDAQGRTRHQEFGEGDFVASERVLQQLLAEAGNPVDSNPVKVSAAGIQQAADLRNLRSPEAYLGYGRTDGFVSPGGARRDIASRYDAPAGLRLNQWGLTGTWTISAEHVRLNGSGGRIVHRFHARDLHLVLGLPSDGKPVRFRVRIDGVAPGSAHGTDIDPQGLGTVTSERLYQLVRQDGPIRDRTFEIEFLDDGARAYAFTFG